MSGLEPAGPGRQPDGDERARQAGRLGGVQGPRPREATGVTEPGQLLPAPAKLTAPLLRPEHAGLMATKYPHLAFEPPSFPAAEGCDYETDLLRCRCIVRGVRLIEAWRAPTRRGNEPRVADHSVVRPHASPAYGPRAHHDLCRFYNIEGAVRLQRQRQVVHLQHVGEKAQEYAAWRKGGGGVGHTRHGTGRSRTMRSSSRSSKPRRRHPASARDCGVGNHRIDVALGALDHVGAEIVGDPTTRDRRRPSAERW